MATLRERWTQIFTFLSRAVTILLGIGLLLALFSSAPQKKITLEAGTEGGLFDVMAKQLADDLEPHGIDVTIVNRPDSLKIIDDIVDPKSPVEAGFVASDAPLSYYDKVSQVGTVMIAPVYLITHVESDVRDISDFANRSISLYPVGSAAWAACDYILESYDVKIVDANSQYGNGKTIVKNIEDRVTDVGCFVDVPSGASSDYADAILAELANPDLRFIPIPQAQALQARRDFLHPHHSVGCIQRISPPPVCRRPDDRRKHYLHRKEITASRAGRHDRQRTVPGLPRVHSRQPSR